MDIITYALSKKIAEHALSGVQSMSINGQTLIINTKDGGVLTMTFPTPKDGVSVTDIDVNANNQIVFTMSDGTEFISGKIPTVKGEPGFNPTITENADNTDKIYKLDITTADSTFTTPNLKGKDGTGGTGASTWSEISDKPFESLSTDFSVENGELKVVGGSGSGETNTIDSISVNGVNVSPDENKNVDITVPSIEGLTKDADLATVAKSGSYEDLINKPTIPDIMGLATETYVDNKVADYTKTADLADVATTGSYNDLVDKPTIPSLDGYAKTTDIPSKVSQLENDSNYLSSIPEEYVTDTELNAKGYITEHQDISGKVDKVEGKSLISDAEITRLASVDNYDDTDIKAEIAKKADVTSIPSKVSVLENDSKYQTESDVTTTLADYATKTYVGEQITNTEHLKREIVTVLPSDEDASDNIIYMLKVESTVGNDKYQEYMKIDGTIQMVGDTSVDLTDYAKSADIPTTVAELTDGADYVKAADVKTELDKKVSTTDIVDSLISDATNKPLSAAQGKALDTKISDLATTVEENYAKKTDLHSHENKTVLDGITEEKVTAWDNAQENVIETVKVNGTALTPSNKAVNIDLSDYAKTADIPTTLPANGGNADTVNNHTVKSDVPENAVFTDTVLEVNDADVSKTTVWSSDKVASEIASAIAGGEVDLSAYQKKNDTGLCTIAQDVVGAINEVKEAVDGKINYDDTEVKADIAELKTKAHTHANTEVLNSITSENIQSWNNKSEFDGNYNTLTNKPTLPVKLSDLTNDSGYITNIADDLLNYYKKSDTYSKEEIAELIGNINKLTSEIVESLPTENISTSTIYLIKEGNTNNYKQYMYISGAWAQLSDTNIDLSGYAKLTDLDTKVDKVTGKTLSTNDFTNVFKSKLDGIAEGANKTVVDSEFSTTSLNPVQNAVVTTKINTLANKDGSDATGTWGIDISGTAAKATADKNGNDITTTYTKQADFEKIVGNVDIINYTDQIIKNTDVVAYTFSTNIRKVGHIVTFVINITVKAVPRSYVELGTIPKGVRPPADVSYNILTNKGDACYVYVDHDGKFGIRKISATSFEANDGVRFCANYITEE